jgi:type II secretory pathway pseudopilin PulG
MRYRGFRSQITNHKLQIGERGYILITLMLFVALLSIAALAVLPQLKQQVLRDRENEMRHRGTAYMRAIQRYYKKNGRYPARIEELENTNNIRYIRKRYKDPMAVDPETHKEKDFKLLRMGDKELNVLGTGGMGIGGIGGGIGIGGLGGGQMPGQLPGVGTAPGQGPGQMAGQFGAGIQTALNRQTGGMSQTVQQGDDSGTANPAGSNAGDTSENNPSNQVTTTQPNSGPLGANSAGGKNPLVLGGGPILGVTSTNKDKSIREFGEKIKHYNEWLFVYDPGTDRGGLISGPVVPNAPVGGGMGTPAGTMATQSQGGASGIQPQKSPLQQGPPTQQPQEPPEEQ